MKDEHFHKEVGKTMFNSSRTSLFDSGVVLKRGDVDTWPVHKEGDKTLLGQGSRKPGEVGRQKYVPRGGAGEIQR